MDFLSILGDADHRCRVLAIIDLCAVERVAFFAHTSTFGALTARGLDAIVSRSDKPKAAVSDSATR